jgi:hypothetical protein
LAQALSFSRGRTASSAARTPSGGAACCRPWKKPTRCLGVIAESDRDQFFSYDDEDALTVLAGQLAQALAALQAAEVHAAIVPKPEPAGTPGNAAAAVGPPLVVRHYARDHSVFLDDAYLIKGVAGAIVRKLVNDAAQRVRSEFTTRELRLGGGDLRLPEVQDNLGVRLLLLERRLAERNAGIRIERTGRGRFRLAMQRPLQLLSEAG